MASKIVVVGIHLVDISVIVKVLMGLVCARSRDKLFACRFWVHGRRANLPKVHELTELTRLIFVLVVIGGRNVLTEFKMILPCSRL